MAFVEEGSECPYVPLGQWVGWDEYFKSLSKSTRKKVKHNTNRLNKSGDIRYEHKLLTEDDTFSFAEAKELERISKKAQKIDILGLVGTKNSIFQNELQSKCTFQILLSMLKKDNELVSYNYGYIYGNVYYFYNTAFSDKEKNNSPGMLIFKDLVSYLFRENICELDCLRGATVNKNRWANYSRIQQNLYYLRNSPSNFLYILLVFKLRPFIKNVAFYLFRKKQL